MEKEKKKSFEENLEELENIVKDLESGEVSLDKAMNEFEKAIKLSKACDETLKKAEESVNKIVNKDKTLSDFTVEE